MRNTISRGRARRRDLLVGATAIIAILGLTSCSADAISNAQNNTDAPEAEASAVLEPFDPNAPAGEAPTDLPNRLGAVLPVADASYQSIDSALRAGAEVAGLEYVSAFSDGNQDDMLSKGQTILDQGVAGLYSFAINRESEEPLMKVSASTLPLIPPTSCRIAPKRCGPALSAITIIAVHLFAIFASDVRDGHVASMTFQAGVVTGAPLGYTAIPGYRGKPKGALSRGGTRSSADAGCCRRRGSTTATWLLPR